MKTKEISAHTGHESLMHPTIGELLIMITDPVVKLQEIADAALHCAQTITESEHGYVSSLNPLTGDVCVVRFTSLMQRFANQNKIKYLFPKDGHVTHEGIESEVLYNPEPFYTNDASRHELLKRIAGHDLPIARFLTAPAAIGAAHLGQISLANSKREYTERDLAHVLIIARLFALGAQRAEDWGEKILSPGHSTYRKYSERITELEKTNEKLLSGVKAMLRTEEMLKASLREKDKLIDKINHSETGTRTDISHSRTRRVRSHTFEKETVRNWAG